MTPVAIQRIESVAIAVGALAATAVAYPAHWWMPLALFLVFDLSALGYLASPRVGAAAYNLGHSYLIPVVVGALALLAPSDARTPLTWWAGIVALSWVFHIAADRALGYGLKLPDAFTHTHLGWIGKDREPKAT
ncbi:DUF4260 domain-containing protein [Microbacterium sp.]|uniref:DUF4260 domain-containing protein n=1 Tax=Microbacterium sp. TaxID=51671 RepID=UPI0039E44AD7